MVCCRPSNAWDFWRIVSILPRPRRRNGSRGLLEIFQSQHHQNVGYDLREGIAVERAHQLNGSFAFVCLQIHGAQGFAFYEPVDGIS